MLSRNHSLSTHFSRCSFVMRLGVGWSLLGRQTQSSAYLGFTAILLLFLLLLLLISSIFVFRRLPSELAERNSTKTGHMLGSECDLKMHVRNLGYTLPCKWGAQNHLFRRFRNLTSILAAYVFSMKCDINNRVNMLETSRASYMVHKRLKIGRAFLPTLHKFYILLHSQALQTEIS